MLVKHAFLELIPISLNKIAIKEKKIVPIGEGNARFLRFRAISALETDGPNGNWDSFLYEDFIDDEPGYGYKSFIGKHAHHEHNSAEGERGSIGTLVDSYLNKFHYNNIEFPKEAKQSSIRNKIDPNWLALLDPKYSSIREKVLSLPDQRDGSIEVLMKIDFDLVNSSKINAKTRQFLQRLSKMIDSGQKLYCSMGTNVQESTCSVCGNVARFASEYCDHLKRGRKGSLVITPANQIRDLLSNNKLRPEWLKHIVMSKYDTNEILDGISNKGVAVRSQEINHKLSFFELSIVATPAFSRADALEKVANQVGNREYLQQLRKQIGDDNIISIYSILQEEGKIGSQCQIQW